MRTWRFPLTALFLSILATVGFQDAHAGSACGAKDQACCVKGNGAADTGSCKSGLECIETISSDTGQFLCQTSGCGVIGGPCCDGASFKCRNQNTDGCNANNKCEKMNCGKEGEECCNIKADTIATDLFTGCQKGLECVALKCFKSSRKIDCSGNDQSCCNGVDCKAGLECVRYNIKDTSNTVCKPRGCGKSGGPCCEGIIKCLQGNLFSCTNGKCPKIGCGDKGQKCCPPSGKPGPNFTGCQKPLKCVQGKCAKKAVACGRLKQKCCKGRKLCMGRLRCRKGICLRGL
jgi:hypothetical protein